MSAGALVEQPHAATGKASFGRRKSLNRAASTGARKQQQKQQVNDKAPSKDQVPAVIPESRTDSPAAVSGGGAAAAAAPVKKQQQPQPQQKAQAQQEGGLDPIPASYAHCLPTAHGPLPVATLAELPDDKRAHADAPAPWVEEWRKRFVPGGSAGEAQQKQEGSDGEGKEKTCMLVPPQEETCRWATVHNPSPRAAAAAARRGLSAPGASPQAGLSPLIFGAGTFGAGQYSSADLLSSSEPVRALRLAFKYGLNAFDTSPYYANSEAVLGRALAVLRDEFPRESYYISTKAGRYGPRASQFDYSPARVRRSVLESIVRLGMQLHGEQAGWIDNVFMHDVEFVCTQVGGSHDAGTHAAQAAGAGPACTQEEREQLLENMGLAPTFAAASRVHGPGDLAVLGAVRELFALRAEGRVKLVGISGYPLPVLLRLARLVATTAPYAPLDTLLSYSHHTLHADVLPAYLPLFAQNPWDLPGAPPRGASPETDRARDCWRPPLVMNASPFSMGLLTEAGPPQWHPCSDQLRAATAESRGALASPSPSASASASASPSPSTTGGSASLAETALQYGIRGSEVRVSADSHHARAHGPHVPQLRTLVGLADVQQVHAAVRAYRTLLAGAAADAEGTADDDDGRLVCPPDFERVDQATGAAEDAAVKDADAPTYAQRYEALHAAEQAVSGIMRARGVFGETWQSPGDHLKC